MADKSFAEAIALLHQDIDLIPEIQVAFLKKLPVKSLLRFRAVCPSFGNLLANHSFIKMHNDEAKKISCLVLHAPRTGGGVPSRVWRQRGYPSLPFRFPRVYRLDTLPGSADITYEHLRFFPRLHAYDKLVGCTVGIVCIRHRDGNRFVLWNPATRMIKHFEVPKLLCEETQTQISVGLGYDCVVHSFKIIRIVDFRVLIYSSNTEIWVPFETGELFDDVARLEGSTIVRGDPYWLAHKNAGEKFFMYFDTARNAFKVVAAPQFRVYLSFELDGALATLRLNGDPRIEVGQPILEDAEVWVLDKVDNSWSQKYSLNFGHSVDGIESFLQFWKGTFLAKVRVQQTLLYNPMEDILFRLRVLGNRLCEACVYTESLAFVPGMLPIAVEEEIVDAPTEPFVTRIEENAAAGH